MRPNRKIRIGAAILAFGLLLWGLYSMMRRLNTTSRPETNLAENTTPATNAAPVSDTGGDRIVFLRDDDNPNDDVKFIPARTILTPDMVEVRRAEVGDTGRFVTDIETGASGFITRRALPFGSQLSKADLVGHISDVGVAGALLPGRRAMVVPITNKSTLHDLVRVGDRVDIVASFDQLEARTVVQDVRVLAVDVFGKDYPQVKVAMRGDYKAPARNVSTANPSSPPNDGAATDAASGGQAAGGAAPAAGQAAPTPSPTPAGAPPAKPDPALTVEVTPEQATAISLTQSAGQNIDFLIRPRSEPSVVPGATTGGTLTAGGTTTDVATVRVASTTRNRLAPYATRMKLSAPAATPRESRSAGGSSSGARRGSGGGGTSRNEFVSPSYPPGNMGSMTVPPAPVNVPSVRTVETYDIPVYGDGKLVRTETVKKPQE